MSEPLPRGWRSLRVGDLAQANEQPVLTGPFGTNIGREDFVSEGCPVLTIGCLTDSGIKLSKAMFVSEEKARELDRYRLRPGDLLFSRMASVGRAGLVPASLDGALFNYHIMRLRLAHQKMLPELFLAYVRGAPAVRNYLEDVNHGATRDGINTSQLVEMPVAVPPIGEQHRILAKLEALQGRSRRAREALDAVPPLLEKLRQSILAAAFRGDLTKDWRAKNKDVEPAAKLLERIRLERRKKWEESELAKMKAKGKRPTDEKWKSKYKEPASVDTTGLPELPRTWCWATVSELASIQLGQRRAPEYANEAEYPYVRAANITWRGLDLSDVKKMGFADPSSVSLEPGDVVLSEASGSPTEVGKPALWQGEIPGCCFQATVLRIRAWDAASVSGRWLHGAFLRNAMLGDFAAMAPGIGILHLTSERMRSWLVPVAPVEEQPVLLDVVATALERAYAAEDTLDELGKGCANLERAVLAKAFRGELVPQDPNDRPGDRVPEHAPTSSPMTRSREAAKPRERAREQTSGARQEEA